MLFRSTSYAVLQCATRPGWSIAAPRRGFMPFYPNWSDKRYDPGLWFDYNGPTAAGGYLINYNHNNQLDQLGGHYTNWQAPPTPSTPGAYLGVMAALTTTSSTGIGRVGVPSGISPS